MTMIRRFRGLTQIKKFKNLDMVQKLQNLLYSMLRYNLT